MTSAVLDTEFTSFDSPALLSVALVSMAAGAELYLEIDPDSPLGRRRLAASSEFVREVVAPQLGFSRSAACNTEEQLAQRARAWLIEHGVTRLVADSDRDLFLLGAAGALPVGIETAVVEARYAPAHQALEDARRLAAALRASAT